MARSGKCYKVTRIVSGWRYLVMADSQQHACDLVGWNRRECIVEHVPGWTVSTPKLLDPLPKKRTRKEDDDDDTD